MSDLCKALKQRDQMLFHQWLESDEWKTVETMVQTHGKLFVYLYRGFVQRFFIFIHSLFKNGWVVCFPYELYSITGGRCVIL